MYLMNVPPVAPIHTEWRTCGPPRGFSLPLCFNDSDSELSSAGTPIPEKVQMIIESLRSTQSSLEMADEIEGNAKSAQDARPQGCKARRQVGGPMAVPKLKCRGSADPLLPEIPSPAGSGSQESDSDDSVDRGIEEAIQEYLKEKDGCKRKAELATNILQPSKIPRTDRTYQEIPKQYPESNKILTTSNQAPKILKTKAPAVPLVPSVKKLNKSKAPLKENPLKRVDMCKVSEVKNMHPGLEQTRGTGVTSPAVDSMTCPAVEEEEDSSSDDGIEEAIQRYQLEKKEDGHRPGDREACKSLAAKEEDTDSSSDDGIEEAIRSYQLEKRNEKKTVPSTLKHKIISKEPASYPSAISSSVQDMKRNRLSCKKKKKTERDVKSLLQDGPPSTLKNRSSVSHKVKRNRGSKMERSLEQRASATLKVATTTTAELMCAEAILDISKAVMPEVFDPNVSLPGRKSPQPSSLLVSSEHRGDERDDSSVDSEDGIEQEICKFLEQKAQMHKRVPDDSMCASVGPDLACDVSGPKGVNKLSLEVLKQGQKKSTRLVTQNKKLVRDCSSSKLVSKEGRLTEQRIQDEGIPKPLTEPFKSANPSASHQRDAQPLRAQSGRKEQSDGDKSSSLDSDEDLDTAIKDLLKTKKKIKKKTRDLKMKSRKGLDTLAPKKLPAEVISKPVALKSVTANTKGRTESKETPRWSKSPPQHKQSSNKRKDSLDRASETGRSKGNGIPESQLGDSDQVIVQIKEDSSSVDSDDSIELEIRKFLAEKAKVYPPMGTVGADEMGKSNIIAGTHLPPEKDIQLENQQAEIPKGDHTQFLESRCSPCASVQEDSQDGGISLNASAASPAYTSSATNLPRNPCLTPAFIPRSSPLEPADGAGPSQTQKQRSFSSGPNDSQNIPSKVTRYGVVPGQGTLARADSDVLHESQAIPLTAETRNSTRSPNPFRSTVPRMGETAVTTLYPYPCGDGIAHRRRNIDSVRDAPVAVCPSARSHQPIVPFHCSPEMLVSAVSRPPFLGSTPTSNRQPAGRYFMQSLVPGGRWDKVPVRSQSTVAHVSKDQTTFVPLSARKTNHIQVRSREASKGKDRSPPVWGEREVGRESKKIEVPAKIAGEGECIDETECESDESRSPVKKQGFSTLSLSKSIDPGGLPCPYIALSTEERSTVFHRRCMALKGQQDMGSCNFVYMRRTEKPVKRQLHFIPSRETGI